MREAGRLPLANARHRLRIAKLCNSDSVPETPRDARLNLSAARFGGESARRSSCLSLGAKRPRKGRASRKFYGHLDDERAPDERAPPVSTVGPHAKADMQTINSYVVYSSPNARRRRRRRRALLAAVPTLFAIAIAAGIVFMGRADDPAAAARSKLDARVVAESSTASRSDDEARIAAFQESVAISHLAPAASAAGADRTADGGARRQADERTASQAGAAANAEERRRRDARSAVASRDARGHTDHSGRPAPGAASRSRAAGRQAAVSRNDRPGCRTRSRRGPGLCPPDDRWRARRARRRPRAGRTLTRGDAEVWR